VKRLMASATDKGHEKKGIINKSLPLGEP